MAKKSKVVLMVGLPCSGKSTWINNQKMDNCVIVSFDNYILENLDSNYNRAWEKYQGLSSCEKTEIFLKINATFEKAISVNKNIVVDFTSLTVLQRKKWLDMTPNYYFKEAIVFRTQFEIILERNKQRLNKTIPVEILEEMKNHFEIPTSIEGFDNIVFVGGFDE